MPIAENVWLTAIPVILKRTSNFEEEDTMDTLQKEHFRLILEGQLDRLMAVSGITVSELMAEGIKNSEYLDIASAAADQAFKMQIRSRESRLIRKIQSALERLDTGEFGICESCGEDIAFRRLEARPVTTKCIHCKTEEERQEVLAQ